MSNKSINSQSEHASEKSDIVKANKGHVGHPHFMVLSAKHLWIKIYCQMNLKFRMNNSNDFSDTEYAY
jgi:hypothetical protein